MAALFDDLDVSCVSVESVDEDHASFCLDTTCQDEGSKDPTDVATMDMRLKGGDVARWLRDTMAVPCIFVSGNLDEATCATLIPLDPIAFVGKLMLPARSIAALARAAKRIGR